LTVSQHSWWSPKAINFGLLVYRAFPDCCLSPCQYESQHIATISDVAIKQLLWVDDFHQMPGFINITNQCTNPFGEIIYR
jgi:hypothetical protein